MMFTFLKQFTVSTLSRVKSVVKFVLLSFYAAMYRRDNHVINKSQTTLLIISVRLAKVYTRPYLYSTSILQSSPGASSPHCLIYYFNYLLALGWI